MRFQTVSSPATLCGASGVGRIRHCWIANSTVGARIRTIRVAHGLTLGALAAKCGISKANLSRVENGKVTPTFRSLKVLAGALGTHPALFSKDPNDAWLRTQYEFDKWNADLRWKADGSPFVAVHSADIVKVFLAARPQHGYAREELLKHANYAPPDDPTIPEYSLDAEKWAQ